ncbi:hypothetical protein D3C85_1005760 [compost metagenome]
MAALRRPGAEVKEGLIPVNLLYVSQGLSDNLTAEAFYQLEWKNSVIDNCGTFFGNDVTPEGCTDRAVLAGLDLAPGVANNTGTPGVTDDAFIPRTKTKDAKDSGQFGVALRWFMPELNDTEFGAYAMNYHSFATNVAGTSLGGEVSFRPNMPLNLNGADINLAAIGNAASPLFQSGNSSNVAGAALDGYKRMPVVQAQMTATRFFDQIMGAERLTLVGEVGYNHINGLGSSDGTELRFGRNTVFGAGELVNQAVCVGANQPVPGQPGVTAPSNPQQECNSHGFYTSSSWGYRLRGKLEYPDVFAGINLSPNLAWSHDVDGVGPNFEEGSKAVSIGVDADYLNTYTASLSYTDYFGGQWNTNADRDYVALSFGVNF